MTGKEQILRAIRYEPIEGHVPHFENVFFLTMEAFGRIHPVHRNFYQWNQMSRSEQELQICDLADIHMEVAVRYNHSAILVHSPIQEFSVLWRILEKIREKSGDEYFLMLLADPTHSIPNGQNMMDFSLRMYEDPDGLIGESRQWMDGMLEQARKFSGSGLLDGYAMCSDYCFNANPFFSNEMFDLLIVPILKDTIAAFREMGFYSLKHTDGNIMPILEQILECKPDILHSLDPQGGVDLAEVKRIVNGRTALMGNVNCGLLQTGTEEQVRTDVKRALRDGMPGGGFIFSTSNCIYTGLALERYELMHRLWLEHGRYDRLSAPCTGSEKEDCSL